MLIPTAWCPRCEMFVPIDKEGTCESCRDRIVFLQNDTGRMEISNGEMEI